MKTFFVKKRKESSKPVVGASVLEKKPAMGSYISFNVATDVKVACGLSGAFDINPLTGNLSVTADSVYINVDTVGGGSLDYSGVDFYFSMPAYGQPHTVDQLLEMANKRCAGMFHFVVENNNIYLVKNGLTSEISTITIGAEYN